jgi:CelD/BcsL family acetyltransferase involved in cellulose biosynthesis
MPGNGPLSVATIAIDDALATLRDEWGATHRESIDDPTLSPDWLQIWWQHFGQPSSDRVLSLTASDGKVAGLLFTRFQTEYYYRLPVRTIRCWVNSHAQRAGLFLRCDAETAAQTLAEHWLRRDGWDLIRLQGLPDDEFTSALVRHITALRGRCVLFRNWSHSRLRIDRPWKDYYYGVVAGDTRRRFERQGRSLAKVGKLTWRNYDSVENLKTAFEEFVQLESQSWKSSSGETIAKSAELATFYRDIFYTFAAKGMASIPVLYLDGAPICAALNLIGRDRLLTLKGSFDERLAKYSPGSQLFPRIIEHAFHEKLGEVDFYSKISFAQRWTKDERRFIDFQIEGPGIRSRLVGWARATRHWWLAREAARGPETHDPGSDEPQQKAQSAEPKAGAQKPATKNRAELN